MLAATVREMFTAGVAAAYTGVPLHKVLICKGSIEAAFGGAKIIQREPVKNLLLVRGTDLTIPQSRRRCWRQCCCGRCCCCWTALAKSHYAIVSQSHSVPVSPLSNLQDLLKLLALATDDPRLAKCDPTQLCGVAGVAQVTGLQVPLKMNE